MNALTGARRPRWRYELLDRDDVPLGALDGVSGGSVELVALSRLGGSGSLTLDDRGQDIDWMSHRVRVSYDPGVRGVKAWPIATMLFTSPTEIHEATGTRFEVELLPKLAVIDEDTVEGVFSLPAGAKIIPAVRSLIESTGETRIAVTDSDAVTKGQIVWEAGTPKLTIVNDLLEAAGYWSLWCDGDGQFRVEPYVAPGERAPSWVFEAGEASVHSADWSREQDLSSVPNRFVVVGQGDDKTPPLVGVALNEDPESPFSYQARGRWITASEEGAEVASQAAATQLAQRRLRDAMSPVGKVTAEHAILPLEPNQVVEFRPASAFARRLTIQRMSFEVGFDAQCSAEWREI